MSTSTTTPLSAANGDHASVAKVSGTSAGRGSIKRRPNRFAMRYAKSVAPIFGIDRPPVATTTRCATIVPARGPETEAPGRSRAIVDDAYGSAPLHAAGLAFGDQHRDDPFARLVAEQLAPMLLVEADAMALDQRDEVRGV